MPSKDKFYSSLTGYKISDKDYKNFVNVWEMFGMKSMKDYHDLHLKSDALLLADVYRNLWSEFFDSFKLDSSRIFLQLAIAHIQF